MTPDPETSRLYSPPSHWGTQATSTESAHQLVSLPSCDENGVEFRAGVCEAAATMKSAKGSRVLLVVFAVVALLVVLVGARSTLRSMEMRADTAQNPIE
jgi:hypothetical protein